MNIKDIVPFWKRSIPVRREEQNPFALLRDEINNLFDNFFRRWDVEHFLGTDRFGTFDPKIDIVEKDKEIKVSAELPGVDEKDIDVSITKHTLIIKGEKKEEKEDKGKNYYRMERSYGSFIRTIPIPVEIDTDKAKAQFKKGVLTITMPKTAKAIKETKKIPVKAE